MTKSFLSVCSCERVRACVCGECETATTKDSISRLFDRKQKLHWEKAVSDFGWVLVNDFNEVLFKKKTEMPVLKEYIKMCICSEDI